jgi:hypothetical protein
MSAFHVDGGWWALLLFAALIFVLVISLKERGWIPVPSFGKPDDKDSIQESRPQPTPTVAAVGPRHISSIPIGKIVGYGLVALVLLWLIFGGGWNTLTGWIPTSRTVQHTKVVYQTKVERPAFVPMTQAQVCSSIPVRTLDLYTTTWTDLIAIPPGCIAMTDLTPGEGFVNQCKGMNGEYPIACGGNGTEIQYQKLGDNDGKSLKLRFWFAPLTTK